MEKRMDPNEDIIDVLYKNKTDENGKNTNSSSTSPNHHGLKRQVQRQASIQTYGFAYTHPPSRNYYEDLFTIQRRNFHGSDSVFGHHTFEKRPLSRTDSISQATFFSFPSPSRQEQIRRSIKYDTLRNRARRAKSSESTARKTSFNEASGINEGFYTPETEEAPSTPIMRSVRREIIYADEEDSEYLNSRRNDMLLELPNGARQKRINLAEFEDESSNLSRSNSKATGIYSSIDYPTTTNENTDDNLPMNMAPWKPLLKTTNTLVGLTVMIILCYKWSNYLQTLHENDMWFSNIKEVEREISFRTEQGLYYSYFKVLTQAKTIFDGIEELKKDNSTEHARTINIFQRFNVHQEMILSVIYRLYSFDMKPILFYVEMVFSLQGLYAAMLFLISWNLSGTWLSGVLTMFFLVIHRSEITRVSFTVPLREHFSLPFFYAMLVSIGKYFRLHQDPKIYQLPSPWNRTDFTLMQIFVMALFFLLTWQFAQFALLLHSIGLFGMAILKLLNSDQVSKIMFVQFCSIICVWYLQYYQSMIINSLAVSFIPLAILSLQSQSSSSEGADPKIWRTNSIFKNLNIIFVRSSLVLLGSLALNMTLKTFMNQTADNHIFTFVASWFGYSDITDFDTRLYHCLAIFKPLSLTMYKTLCSNGALPIYVIYMSLQAIFLVLTVFKLWYVKEKQEPPVQTAVTKAENNADKNKKIIVVEEEKSLVQRLYDHDQCQFMVTMDKSAEHTYHIGTSLIFALLGVLMARMIVFWSPYIMVLTSVAICDLRLWTFLVNKLNQSSTNQVLVTFLRHLILCFLLAVIYISHKDAILAHLEELREFWDPDTVDLMEWIQQKVPLTAAFTGTMQLMAGIRLCTMRPITNHPHFEDKELRIRTKELYKMYGQFAPEEVYETMVKYNTSFMILEDSQCMNYGRPDRCGLPDTVDLTYGHITSDGKRDPPHLVNSKYPRFCDEIRYGASKYTKYFRLVFQNKTFRVYEIKPWKGNFTNNKITAL